MKRFLTTLCTMLLCMTLHAQMPQPVKWSTEVLHIEGDVFQVRLTADITTPWHIYDMGPYEGGPMPVSFEFTPSSTLSLDGGVQMLTEPVRVFDDIFGMQVGYFEGQAVFSQQVTLDGKGGVLAGTVEWVACNPETNQCLSPAEYEFSANIGRGAPEISETENMTAETREESGSLWTSIIEAILWGFAALLTPCVFPMVPMTVSFFLKNGGSPARGRLRAMFYGLFIIALYTVPIGIIILVTRIVGGQAVTADIFNWLATHWIPNLLFFIVFMIFAASFFGAFEITLPSRLVNDTDRKADRGGLAGTFFMALTLVLVSFSCTGPIVGSVLINSTSGMVWQPVITMLAFSTAFALPFTLLALFPSLLDRLPKSGGWLNSVKVVLGFIEVALGFKFLSVADQTYHWGLLDREVYLAIWIATFSLLGLYLLGKIRFKYDEADKPLSVVRLSLAIAVFSLVVYMIPGMWGAPLKALSGYLPPITTQDFVMGNTPSRQTAHEAQRNNDVKYSDMLSLPYGLEGFFDFEQGMQYARKVGKPVFLDYTGHGCVNCREMEARVWSAPEVDRILREDYVIIALYGDDKTKLDRQDYLQTKEGKTLKSIGKKNAYIVNTLYGISSQPAYLLLSDDGDLLVPPRGYNLDVQGYVDFLKSGLKEYYR